MDVENSSLQKLCEQLISLGIQRCRLSSDFCRLSVSISRSPETDPPKIQISISDTGVGSTLEEFHGFKYGSGGFSVLGWDGTLSVITTGINDDEIFHYMLNLKETSSRRRVTSLPSRTKNNAKFSGSEVSLFSTVDMEVFVAGITSFLKKLLMLKPQNIAVELMVQSGNHAGSQHENVILTNGSALLSLSTSTSIEQLQEGLQEHVLRHGDLSNDKCLSCFPNNEHLKMGGGQALSEIHQDNQLILEVVIIISESSDAGSSCPMANTMFTEVLYFKDFCPSSIEPSVSNALKAVNWNSYGLTMKNITNGGGSATLEWESMPPNLHINIALHCYHKQVDRSPFRKRSKIGGKLTKKSVNEALLELKQNYPGCLLSARALKIRDYAPDLAKSLAGLILTSRDHTFQRECFSLLQLDAEATGVNAVENCIKEKIISAIEMDDRKPPSNFHQQAPAFLFEADSNSQGSAFQFDVDEDGEDGFCYMDY